ncbi:13434_t:CDS:2 [Cetraspora pellucida]|uniref:13434_t:CDS:1 n=1 Tax=Cetraspora pellucida TaxID=1433469 RepID=A0A9N8YXF8_9GLOM|nr:13434_t:CDS:2 [Cetraspora pellucida]
MSNAQEALEEALEEAFEPRWRQYRYKEVPLYGEIRYYRCLPLI